MPSHMGRVLWSHHMNWASKVVRVGVQVVGAVQGPVCDLCLRASGVGGCMKRPHLSRAAPEGTGESLERLCYY